MSSIIALDPECILLQYGASFHCILPFAAEEPQGHCATKCAVRKNDEIVEREGDEILVAHVESWKRRIEGGHGMLFRRVTGLDSGTLRRPKTRCMAREDSRQVSHGPLSMK